MVQLEQVEQQLAQLEQMRAEAMLIFWPVLEVNSKLKSGYELALSKHRALCQQVCDYKLELSANNCSVEEIEACSNWAQSTANDLVRIFWLIDFAKEHHYIPSSWIAPAGFEFLKE